MKFRKNFIVLPILRSGGDDISEKHADWLELLYDLIFVAAISQITLNLSNNYSYIIFLESLPLFFRHLVGLDWSHFLSGPFRNR